MKYVAGKWKIPSLPVCLASVLMMFLLFFSTAGETGYHHSFAPAISPSATKALLDIKKIVPKHSAMFTPFWEYGYPLMDLGEFATYHDGGVQGGMRTTLAAKAMTSSSQQEMVSLLSYLEDYGFHHLHAVARKENLTADQMMERVFQYPGVFKGEKVYVFYLEEMIWRLPNIAYFGTWDFDQRKSDDLSYVELNCFDLKNDIMTCSDGTIDFNRGVMNDGSVDIPLSSALFINDGYVINKENYDHPDGYYLQVLMKNEKIFRILVADERLFRTNFNQQYLLGNYDRRYFEEVYNNWPVGRVLKVKNAGSMVQAQSGKHPREARN